MYYPNSPLQSFIVVAAVFFVLRLALTRLVHVVDRRMSRHRLAGGDDSRDRRSPSYHWWASPLREPGTSPAGRHGGRESPFARAATGFPVPFDELAALVAAGEADRPDPRSPS